MAIIHNYLVMRATTCFPQKTKFEKMRDVFSEILVSLDSSHLPFTVFENIRSMKEFLAVLLALAILPVILSSTESIDSCHDLDCSIYESCTECVSSTSSCNWCLRSHRCVEHADDKCRNDVIVAGDNVSDANDARIFYFSILIFLSSANWNESPKGPQILSNHQR